MGRKRRTDRHLPQRMYRVHSSYWFRPKTGKPVNLGPDLAEALTKYGLLLGFAWSSRTLGDVIDRYRVEVLSLKKSQKTRDEQGAQLTRLKKAFGHFIPDNVTSQMCYAYADARRGKNGKPVPVAARHEVSLLGHVYRRAIRWGAASANPAKGLEFERTGQRPEVTIAQVAALRAIANPRTQIIIDLAVLTGQRLGDILKMKREDQVGDVLKIVQSKTGAKIDMEMSPALAAVIAKAKAMPPQLGGGKAYLLRSRTGDRYTESGFKAIWQRLMRKYTLRGAKRFTFHDLRSVSADGAETLEEARARLGHATSATTKRFYRRAPEKAKPRS